MPVHIVYTLYYFFNKVVCYLLSDKASDSQRPWRVGCLVDLLFRGRHVKESLSLDYTKLPFVNRSGMPPFLLFFQRFLFLIGIRSDRIFFVVP